MPDAQFDSRHPHEPEVPPTFDGEGRCLVCGLVVKAQAKAAKAERARVLQKLKAVVAELER